MTLEEMRRAEINLLRLTERVEAMRNELRRALAELDERFDEYERKEARYDH